MNTVYLNGEFMPMDQARISPMDRGFLFGDGVYEVLRSYHGKLFALDEHMARFSNSLEAVDITGVDTDDIRRRVVRAYDHAGLADAVVYFHMTRGSGTRALVSADDMEPNFFLTVTPMSDLSEAKARGIAVSTHPDYRWKLCHIKSLNLLPNVLARRDAEKKG